MIFKGEKRMEITITMNYEEFCKYQQYLRNESFEVQKRENYINEISNRMRTLAVAVLNQDDEMAEMLARDWLS